MISKCTGQPNLASVKSRKRTNLLRTLLMVMEKQPYELKTIGQNAEFNIGMDWG
jgi:hypothetical protein